MVQIITVIHHLEDGKISEFKTDQEFYRFVHKIMTENGDDFGFLYAKGIDAIDYIDNYCDNLKLTYKRV